ncbi:MAG: O-antigen ligase family protein [bacterium]|nr:O-antigen ligase family protein [bacterium]
MNIFKNETQLTNIRIGILALLAFVIIGALVVPVPVLAMKILVIGSLFLGVLTYAFEGVFHVEDLPFLFLLVGTFVLGKAFSIIGFKVGGFPLFATELALFFSVGMLAILRLKKAMGNWKEQLTPALAAGIVIYIAVGTLYVLVGFKTRGTLALRDIVFCHYAVLFFITIHALRTQERIKKFVALLIPAIVTIVLIGIVKNFTIHPSRYALNRFVRDTKAFNWAFIFGMVALLALTYFAYAKIKKVKLGKGFLIYTGLLFVVLTSVRAGWAGLFAAFLFLAIVLKKEMRVLLVIIPLLVATLFIYDKLYSKKDTLAVLTEEVTSIMPDQKYSVSKMNIKWRMDIWGQTLNYIKEKPLLGYGFGSFPSYLIWGRKAPKIKGPGTGSRIVPPHNHLLAVLYKMGILGLALFIFINLYIFLQGVKYLGKCKTEFNRRFLIAALAGLIYWHGIAFFFDVLESPPTSILLWIILGSIVSVVQVDKKNNEREMHE